MKSDSKSEVWLSLVERFVRDEEAAGSNPVTSTIWKRPSAYADGLFVLFNGKRVLNRLFKQKRKEDC